MNWFTGVYLRSACRTTLATWIPIAAIASQLQGCGSGGAGGDGGASPDAGSGSAPGTPGQPATALANEVRVTQLWTASSRGPGSGAPQFFIHGFDLGTRYLWVVEERTSASSSEHVYYALTSTDLVNFTSQPILLDGVPAGSPIGTSQTRTSLPPQKIVAFKGKYLSVPSFPNSVSGPSDLYTSDDAINWTSVRGLTAGQTRYWFHMDDVAQNCPSSVPIADQVCEWVEDIETDANGTALYVLLRSRILKSTDGTNWTAPVLPDSCRRVNNSGQVYERLAIKGNTVFLGASNTGPSCMSNDGGTTWQPVVPETVMGTFQPDTYGTNLRYVFSVGDRFYSDGGYSYRDWWLTSTDGLKWEAIPGPKPQNCGNELPVSDTIAYNGKMFVDLFPVCLERGAVDNIYGVAYSANGTNWQYRPFVGGRRPALAPEVAVPSAVNGILRNFVVVRGTNDVIVPGSVAAAQGTAANPVHGLVRIHLD